MYYVGIDPGRTGALTIFKEGVKYPVKVFIFKKKYAAHHLAHEIVTAIKETVTPECVCYLEKVHSRPTDSRSNAFTFGRYTGIVEGALGAIGLPYSEIRPQDWKKRYGLLNSLLTYTQKKKAAKEKVLELFPELPKYPIEVYDSILIAYYLKQDTIKETKEN